MHHTSKRIKDGLGCEILRGNQVDKVLLAFFLLRLVSASLSCTEVRGEVDLLQDVINCGVGLLEACGEQLRRDADQQTFLRGPVCMNARTFCWPSWLSDETLRHWKGLEG